MEIIQDKPKTMVICETIHNILYYQPANVQRLLSQEHIDKLVEDQINEYQKNKCFSILQSITCADLDNKRYILDGQHRIMAFKILNTMNYSLNQQIPLIIYNIESIDEMKDYYIRINNHNPVNPLEINHDWFDYGKSFCSWMMDEFKEYIRNDPNKRCLCPHIDMTLLQGYLVRMKVFQRLNDISKDDIHGRFRRMILHMNEYIEENIEDITKFQFTSEFKNKLDKCKKKNKKRPCYLGVWRNFEWMEIVINMLRNDENMSMIYLSSFNNERKKIPKSRRYEVWRKRNGTNMEGSCFVCNEYLNFGDMECGHIIPNVYNGSTDLDNLEPICKICNRDMGIMNLTEYKSLLYKK